MITKGENKMNADRLVGRINKMKASGLLKRDSFL